ncbi:MAG: hypothetical protein HYZ84_07500 [Candidatus Omnitrophica bacterium]|nr:hypothetical protein [Candidatus Omnitrophota bacterium]
MEGGRLNKFMKTVESATASLKPQLQADSVIEATEFENEKKTAQEEIEQEETPSNTDKIPSLEPFNDLIKSGIVWLLKLSEQIEKGADPLRNTPAEHAPLKIHRDTITGKQTLQIPLPDEKTIALFGQTFSEIFSRVLNQQKR